MGDTACDRRFCPDCDLAVSCADETCPECGARIDRHADGSTDR